VKKVWKELNIPHTKSRRPWEQFSLLLRRAMGAVRFLRLNASRLSCFVSQAAVLFLCMLEDVLIQ